MEKKELEVGTKYLSCMMDTSVALKLVLEAISEKKDKISFAAFKDETKTAEDNKPLYKSKDVAIWLSRKKSTEDSMESITEETI